MQYIGIITAIAVWAYFEFYRIPRLKELIYTETNSCFTDIKYQADKTDKHETALKGHASAITELQEDVTAIEQRFDIGNKQVPKVISRN